MTDFKQDEHYLNNYDQESLDDLVIDLKLDEATTINNAGRTAQIQYVRECTGETTTREEDLQYVIARLYLIVAEFCTPDERDWALDLTDNFGVPWTGKMAKQADKDHREMMGR